MFENWRFNTFSEVMNSVLIEEEEHTIEYHADWNGYGIQLNEGPQLDNPSSVVIVEDVSGGATFTEVPRTQTPTAGQYRVDYAASTYYGTGRVQFNAADNGKKVVVTYYGTGWTVKNNYRQSQLTVPTNMEVEEDVTIHGDLTLDGENTGGGNLDVAGDATVQGDADINGNVTIGGPTGTGDLYVGGDVDVDGTIAGHVEGDASSFIGAIKETGSSAGTIHKKIIEIGDWNMDSTGSVQINHGLDISKIRYFYAVIREDEGTTLYDINIQNSDPVNVGGGAIICHSTYITLTRFTGGSFDSGYFDSTSYNRGWIIIEYID